MNILICGDRDYGEVSTMTQVFDMLKISDKDVVIEGEARGADLMAREIAESRDITVKPFPAQWKLHGNSAGPIRNREMLKKGEPDLVVAFHDDICNSRGTKDMIKISLKDKVKVILVANCMMYTITEMTEI